MNSIIEKLKTTLNEIPAITAAYIFGSTVDGSKITNDIDIIVLTLIPSEFQQHYLEFISKIADALNVKPDKIDLLAFDLNLADPEIIYRAIDEGIMLKNTNPDFLSDKIESLSRFFLENEYLLKENKRYRKERLEEFCVD